MYIIDPTCVCVLVKFILNIIWYIESCSVHDLFLFKGKLMGKQSTISSLHAY